MGEVEAGMPTLRVMNECIFIRRRTVCCLLQCGIKVTRMNIFIYVGDTRHGCRMLIRKLNGTHNLGVIYV